jgi:hypothetical protein
MNIEMDVIYNRFSSMWDAALIRTNNNNNNNDNNNKVNYVFRRVHLIADNVEDMELYLKNEFLNSNFNIYELHLYLIDQAFDHYNRLTYNLPNQVRNEFYHRSVVGLFINYIFVQWYNQRRNQLKRQTSSSATAVSFQQQQQQQQQPQSEEEALAAYYQTPPTISYEPIEHFTKTCTDQVCNCYLDDTLVLRAFFLLIQRNLISHLSASFSKIYYFEEKYETLLRPHVHEVLQQLSHADQALIIKEFKLQNEFEIDKVISF